MTTPLYPMGRPNKAVLPVTSAKPVEADIVIETVLERTVAVTKFVRFSRTVQIFDFYPRIQA